VLKILIEGVYPVPKSYELGRTKTGKMIRLSTIATKYETWVAAQVRAHLPREFQPFLKKKAVLIDFFFQFETSCHKKNPIGSYHIVKPDVTNLQKSGEDAMVKAKVIGDDAQVAETRSQKRWGSKDLIFITIRQELE